MYSYKEYNCLQAWHRLRYDNKYKQGFNHRLDTGIVQD